MTAMLESTMVDMEIFDSRESLAENLAKSIGDSLREAISERGAASMAVSGGSTPKLMFQALSQQDVDWSRVTITLVDDRCVAPNHDRSNDRFVRLNLMQNWAAQARFLPLIGAKAEDLTALMPFSICLLGMGTDGHTASFFPSGDTLAQATDPKQAAPMIHLSAKGAGEERVTLTLPAIISAKRLILHIEGAEKRAVLDKAQKSGDANKLPIRHVLRASKTIETYWAA
ncbi:6-phosphogluconolactonase [Pseudahrensia aquimaris]|uniref:6-phosphogluconolactonase n=1 Tax=Pseudahrensia aquimaris TaxID=744461 RepID=A0ABW3FHA3_9HYPH